MVMMFIGSMNVQQIYENHFLKVKIILELKFIMLKSKSLCMNFILIFWCFWNYSWHEYYINFRCTAQSLDIYITYKVTYRKNNSQWKYITKDIYLIYIKNSKYQWWTYKKTIKSSKHLDRLYEKSHVCI